MTRKDEKRQTIDTYNKTAQTHAKKFDKTGVRIDDIEKAFSYIRRLNPKTIELGCGNGRDAEGIVKRTNDYLGIDLSSELIKIAKKKVPEANFRVADFETFKFSKDVDVIFAFASLLHSDRESVRKLIKRAHRALSPGGIFFISSKHSNYCKKTIDKEGYGPKTYYFYTPREIEKLLPVGFEIIFRKPYHLRGQKWFIVILQKVR